MFVLAFGGARRFGGVLWRSWAGAFLGAGERLLAAGAGLGRGLGGPHACDRRPLVADNPRGATRGAASADEPGTRTVAADMLLVEP